MKLTEPQIRVGIMCEQEIIFRLNGRYLLAPNGIPFDKIQKVSFKEREIWLNDEPTGEQSLIFEPVRYHESSFELNDVTIGVSFHWERKEDQTFRGSLEILADDRQLWAINHIPLEDYLVSVISSEMKATSSSELLKAHSIISRSWLMAQIEKGKKLNMSGEKYKCINETGDEYIRWYDREDHQLFDVCADDHCQRYQGITRQSTPLVEAAVAETRGVFLTSDDAICDARFSKSCGGITEAFENAWEPEVHAYLQSIIDNPVAVADFETDLTDENFAEEWIRNSPEAFCNTTDRNVLSQVLNDYDQETHDFYRWKVIFSQDELADLIRRKTGRDFGQIIDLVPVERGKSGRLIRLKIIGTKLTKTIGKELEIRKTLSESHLYSSAFVVDKQNVVDSIPCNFVLTGAGWGHGVGLCQIGAAMMAEKGYSYDQILLHYFKGASLSKRY